MRLRPIALPAAIAALALGGLAAPAQAAPDDEEPLVGVIIPEQVTVIAGRTKTVRAEVLNIGPQTAKNVVVDFTHIGSGVELTLPAGCDATSCQVGDLPANGRKTLSITIGVSGDKLVSGFDVGVGGFVSEVTVLRSTGGVDLELEPIADLKLGRGQSATLPITVHNAGSEAVDKVGVALVGEPGLAVFAKYRNCVSLAELEGAADNEPGVLCMFDEEFTPGSTFKVPAASPLKIGVNKDAGGPYMYTAAVMAVGLNDSDVALLSKRKTGEVLALDALTRTSDIDDGDVPDDINEEDNIALFGVSVGKSSADSAALGATISGAGGEKKTFEVGVRNLGPTTVIPISDDFEWFASVKVSVPSGVKLTEVDEMCMPEGDGEFTKPGTVDGQDYICVPELGLGVGATSKFTFTGTLTGDESEAGSVVVDGGVQDKNAKNDKAAITVALTGAGGEGGGLPVTGTPTGLVALGGALLLLAGGAAAYFFRRRRIVTTL